MNAGRGSDRNAVTRRTFLGAGVASAALAGSALAQQPAPAPPAPRAKGPAVWLDMDQAELDAAYDQIKYAPNLPQIVKRYATTARPCGPGWALRDATPTGRRPSRRWMST